LKEGRREPFRGAFFFRFLINNILNNWHMSCMVTVFACDLSMECNTPLINRNMAETLLMIGFLVESRNFI